MSVTARVGRLSSRRELVAGLLAVCAVEAALLVAYVFTSPGFVTEPRYLIYPFVWLNAAGLAVLATPVPSASTRRRALAATLGVGYFLLLGVVDGTIALAPAAGFEVYWSLPPGWGPILVADAGPLRIALVPYRVVGYAAVAYLLAATLLEASSRAVGGLVGLFSCVSCTLPVVAAALSGVAGGVGLASAAAWSYDLSTVVFLVTVGILVRGTGGRETSVV